MAQERVKTKKPKPKPSGPPKWADLPATVEAIERGERAGPVPAGPQLSLLTEPADPLDDSRAARVARFIGGTEHGRNVR